MSTSTVAVRPLTAEQVATMRQAVEALREVLGTVESLYSDVEPLLTAIGEDAGTLDTEAAEELRVDTYARDLRQVAEELGEVVDALVLGIAPDPDEVPATT